MLADFEEPVMTRHSLIADVIPSGQAVAISLELRPAL